MSIFSKSNVKNVQGAFPKQDAPAPITPTTQNGSHTMPTKVLIAFYSRGGVTEKLAQAIAEGADAIVFGTPTRFGNVSSELKAFVDSLGGLWFQGKLVGKAGSAFCSTGSPHGGNESTNLTMYNFMAHLGLIIVPLGYGDPIMFQAGTPYGASAISGQNAAPPTANDLEVARYQGRRVAQVARALKAAKQTETK